MKIAQILCPTDFSEPSRHAMEHAAAIAHWSGARVIPLHVETPVYAMVPAVIGGGSEHAPGGTQIVYGESPAQAIAEFAAATAVDLIVIGTHGAGGFRQLILGSVTETLLREVDCPVLIVPPRAESTARLPFARILSAVDFSASSLAALRLACLLAEDAGATLDVVHVIDEPDPHALFVARPHDVRHHPEVYERRIAEHLERTLPPNTCEFSRVKYRIGHGVPETEILRVAADAGSDAIVLGVGAGKTPVFGSTVNYVVRNARCPVLTVRS
jgi:nucleotide-binding universal stress UspA family protein